jgi:hypothetical protein
MAGTGGAQAPARRSELRWALRRAMPLAAVVLLLAPPVGLAADRVVVQIGTVLATNTGHNFDSHLAAMRQQFENLFRYTSYQLVKQESRDVGWGDPASFEIPGGRYLRVVPKAARNDRLSLNVTLLQDSRLLIDTDFTLPNHGTIMVGGPRYQEGVLIIWIGARME